VNPFAFGVRAYAAYNAARFLEVRVLGREHLPKTGPALIAARHYHHLFDGAVLVDRLPRQPHVFVALDWAQSRGQRLFMETLCNLAEWPIALRSENLTGGRSAGAFARDEARRYLRAAVLRTQSLLRRGEIVAIFPEGYPTIDPAGSRKPSDDAFLPFRNGVLRLALGAARSSGLEVPVVPAGFAYRALSGGRYAVTLRLGTPMIASDARGDTFIAALEDRVRELSAV
jgi:putative membrane protein